MCVLYAGHASVSVTHPVARVCRATMKAAPRADTMPAEVLQGRRPRVRGALAWFRWLRDAPYLPTVSVFVTRVLSLRNDIILSILDYSKYARRLASR